MYKKGERKKEKKKKKRGKGKEGKAPNSHFWLSQKRATKLLSTSSPNTGRF